jgi:hypothetical protein
MIVIDRHYPRKKQAVNARTVHKLLTNTNGMECLCVL